MIVYALFDNVTEDLWSVDGTVITTNDPGRIAMYWLNLEYEEPGRYEIVSGDMCE